MNNSNTSELFELAKNGPLVKLSILAGNGADLSARDSEGKTALMHSAAHNKYAISAVLLNKKYNSDINAVDNNGKTALMYACENGNFKVTAVLLSKKHSCDITITDKTGKTALMYAEEKGDKKSMKLIHKVAKRA